MTVESADTTAQAKKKKQIAIVALLLVGLLVAIVTQPSSKKPTQPSVVSVSPTASIKSNAKANDVDAPRPEFTKTRKLAEVELKQIQRANLFYIPVESAADKQRAVTAQAIYGNAVPKASRGKSKSYRALVGKDIIRSGEVFPDGRRILRVTSDGFELAP